VTVAATIAEVAARAGVSTATVSRVLSGAANALPATRDRVMAAARELDYRPSAIARALKRRETRILGLLVTDIGNPFYPAVARAVEAAADERGYGIVLANGGDDPEREIRHLELLLERRVDGLIVASSRVTRRHAARLRRLPIPIVLVNTTAGAGLPAVLTANRRGGAMAARHLVELGHRRIGYVSAPPEHPAVRLRQRGVADTLPAGAFPIVVMGDGGVDGGEAAISTLLREGATGIVGFNDLTAIGALRGLRRAGAAVPGDVSVVGFDDIEMASWTDPPLTTVRQPTEELGRWAVARLVDVLRGSAPGGERLLLEPELVVRGSTGPPRGSPDSG
jgi:DNA-binding LacI/PurR family transcriptional regulator